jgi:integrase
VVDKHIVPRLGAMKLAKIEPVNVERFYQDMQRDGESAQSCKIAGVLLGNALRYVCKQKLVLHNAVREVDKPRSTKREFVAWTAAQANAFLKAMEFDRLHTIFVLALATGMRQGELFALEWNDIDFAGGYLTVRRSLERTGEGARIKEPKTGKGRRIDLPAVAIDALQDHRKRMLAEGLRTDTVFVNTVGNWLCRQDVNEGKAKPAMKEAGLPVIRFHDLRHTHATLLLAAGENIKVVSERLGHASVNITLQVYAHVLPGMQKRAADTMQKLLG